MTLDELKTILEGVMPDEVVYRAWPVGHASQLPYIAYLATGSDNFAADNIVYRSGTPVRVELYEETKNLTLEGQLEAALTAAGIYWDREETYIDDERCYEIIYEVEING